MEIKRALQMAGEHQHAGRTQQAEVICRRILAEHPDHAETLHLLGILNYQADCHAEAVELVTRAIKAAPAVADYYATLGAVLSAQGRLEQAMAAYRQALKLDPTCAQTHHDLGAALAQGGQMEEALASYRQALALKPAYAGAHNNMGNLLYFQGRLEEAIAAYRQAIALDPRLAPTHNNLGNILQGQGHLDEAMACYRQALALMPDLADAHYNLGSLYRQQGLLDQALGAYRKALQLRPGLLGAHDGLLLTLHYHPDFDQAAIYKEHREWNQQHALPLREHGTEHRNDRNPDRALRIGYVSPDLRLHSVAFFLLPLLQGHDHREFHITCYSADRREDEVTARLRACTDCWRDIACMSDQQAAELVRQDQIDVLVDLSLHTGINRLLLFARKPAPVQVSYLGYPGTTGLDAIGYRLSDGLADPPESEQFSSEQVIRLPQTAWCFDPLLESPPVAPPPCCESGMVTFGSFNHFSKINDALLCSWAQILERTPGSRLLLKNQAMHNPSMRQRVRVTMHSYAVADEQLLLQPSTPSAMEHRQQYSMVDIALDAYPYHGTTTTCETLWMGVPVVTLAGQTAASRVGISLLTNVGLPELVAGSPEEYVRIAVDLANDLPRLVELRSALRQRIQASPLMDAPRFARDVEAAYRTMWRNWCCQVGDDSARHCQEERPCG